MFTTGSKWFFGLAGAALIAAWIYGGATNPAEVGMSTFTGVLTFGYKGGIGDHLGYTILTAIFVVGLFLGATTAAFRDSSAEAGAQLLETETVPPVVAPERGSYWPVVGAFGVSVLTLGLVTTSLLVMLGLVIIAAATFEWAIEAWSERATGDPAVNQAIRRRVMMPIEVPVLGALGVGVLVLAISTILLAAPELIVYIVFGAVPTLVLVIAFVLAARPKMNRSVIAGLCVVGALAILTGGIISAVVGPRDIEPHEEEGDHEGAPVLTPGSPIVVSGSHR